MIEKRTSVIYSIYRARIAVFIALTVAVASLSFVVGEERNQS